MGAAVPADTQVLVGGYPSLEQLTAAPVDALVLPYAGLPSRTRSLLLEHAPRLPVYNQHHNAVAVAECAVALTLALAKHVVPMDRALRAHDWRPRYAPDPALRLAGTRALVLGFGAIGRRVARLLDAVGLDVTATRRSLDAPAIAGDIRLLPAALTRAALPHAQILVLCLPHTADTDGLLDAGALAALAPGSLVINVARAGVIDEQALFDALSSGHLGGAALDVWWRYPDAASRASTPASTLPFHALPNVVLSPHRSGHDRTVEDDRLRDLLVTLRALAGGEAPPHRVNVARGY